MSDATLEQRIAEIRRRQAPLTVTLGCQLHGIFKAQASFGGPMPPCPQCVAAEQERRAAEEAAERRERALNDANLDALLRECTFESFIATSQPQRDVLAACRLFAETFNPEGGA